MIYYKRLTKEERKEVKKKFLESEDSKLYKKANKIFIISIIGILFSCFAVAFDYIYKTGTINYVMDGLLFVFSGYFIYRMNKFKNNEINKFALDNKKGK